MKVRFLADHDSDTRRVTGVVAATENGVYRWIPNFHEWVGDVGADRRLYSHDFDRELVEITPEEAAQLVVSLPLFDARRFAWVLRTFERETDRVSSEDLGLDVELRAKRPTADKHLVENVRNAPLGTWVPMRRFRAGEAVKARQWASEVRLGKKKRLTSLGPLDAKVVHLEDGSLEARVRRSDSDGTALVDAAQRLATAAHGLQKDKAGRLYIDHPRRVAERIRDEGGSAQAQAVGWLHDVLEDTGMTVQDFQDAGIPEPVIQAVEALTKGKDEPLPHYIDRVNKCELARNVKYADVADNLDPERLELLDEVTRARLEAKYANTLALLDAADVARSEVQLAA